MFGVVVCDCLGYLLLVLHGRHVSCMFGVLGCYVGGDFRAVGFALIWCRFCLVLCLRRIV